jgi:hypothetical protein
MQKGREETAFKRKWPHYKKKDIGAKARPQFMERKKQRYEAHTWHGPDSFCEGKVFHERDISTI